MGRVAAVKSTTLDWCKLFFVFNSVQFNHQISCLITSKVESTISNKMCSLISNATACITLAIQQQVDNIMKPIRGQIKHIPSMQHNFINKGPLKLGMLTSFHRIALIERQMPDTGMALYIHRHLITLRWACQNVPPLPTKEGDRIPRHIEEICGRENIFPQGWVNSALLFRRSPWPVTSGIW